MPRETFFNLPDDKRERILDVAIEEFAENDYENASVSRMVEEAGIAKGSFYQYFENKRDLYNYLFELIAARKAELLTQPPPDPRMGIFKYLRWLVEAGLAFEVKYPRLSRIGYRALSNNGLPAAMVAQSAATSQAFFRELVAQGKAQGDIDPAVDADLAAFIFNTVFTELGRYIFDRLEVKPATPQRFFESAEVQTAVDQALRVLERGMGVR